MTDQTNQTFDPIEVRQKAIAARKAMLASRTPKRERVRVSPANDDVRRLLRHPHAGGFPVSGGAADWPLDRFTRRRINDKSVTRAEPEAESEAEPQQQGRPAARAPAPAQRDQ
jgi:hypothetical protein